MRAAEVGSLVEHSLGKAFNACPGCFFKACPKANDKDGICDVCDEVSEERAKEIDKGHAVYKEKVNAKRVLLNKKPINYAGLKTNTHETNAIEGERRMMWDEEMFALVESLAGEDTTPEEPNEEFSGFRHAFFEAREESALRLGTYEDQ